MIGKPYIMHDSTGLITGRISNTIPEYARRTAESCGMQELALPEGISFDTVQDTHYVASGRVVPKEHMSVIVDGARIQAIPAGASIVVEGEEYPIEGSFVELGYDVPGTYTVTLKCEPRYHNLDIEITV